MSVSRAISFPASLHSCTFDLRKPNPLAFSHSWNPSEIPKDSRDSEFYFHWTISTSLLLSVIRLPIVLRTNLQGTPALFESTVEQEWVERLFREITQSSNPFESNKLNPDLSTQMHVLTDTLTHTYSTSPVSFNSPLTGWEMAGSTASTTAF